MSNQKWQNRRMNYRNQNTLDLTLSLLGKKTSSCHSYSSGLFIYSCLLHLLPNGTNTYILIFFKLEVTNELKRSVRWSKLKMVSFLDPFWEQNVRLTKYMAFELLISSGCGEKYILGQVWPEHGACAVGSCTLFLVAISNLPRPRFLLNPFRAWKSFWIHGIWDRNPLIRVCILVFICHPFMKSWQMKAKYWLSLEVK